MCFSYESKKKIRNIVIGLFFLFGGIEYGEYSREMLVYPSRTCIPASLLLKPVEHVGQKIRLSCMVVQYKLLVEDI